MGLCERCKKAQATFHLTNIDPSTGEKVERHLCDRCSVEEGLLQGPKASTSTVEVFEAFIANSKTNVAALSELICEQCGISYVEFRNQGLLGCAADYDNFKEHLARLIERSQNGGTHHTGKAPKSAAAPTRSKTMDLRQLRKQLEDAVAGEDYERAAKLRDRIRELEAS